MTGKAFLGAIFLALGGCAHRPVVNFVTSDVARFYAVYDRAGGAPTAEALQRDYIDTGSAGLHEFIPDRILSGAALAAQIQRDRSLYDHARLCSSALPAVRRRLSRAFAVLASLYPEARFPPITAVIGRNNSAGTTGPSGVLIGLEAACRPNAPNPDVEDHLVHVIAHEYGHVQQFVAGLDQRNTGSVLSRSLIEGVAELVAELVSGKISNDHLNRWTMGREAEIEQAFLADADGTDYSRWLYNGVGTPAQPGDLGYWVGYRIAKAFYLRATDKRAALRTLLQLRDAHAILAQSGWRPGMHFPSR